MPNLTIAVFNSIIERNTERKTAIPSRLDLYRDTFIQIPTDQKNEPLTDEPVSDNDAILPPDIDLPTFNEHTEQQRNQAAEPLADQDMSGSTHSETMADRRGKAKKNYAADSCGAKINKHAPELLVTLA